MPSMSLQQQPGAYALGHSDSELKRLTAQADLFRPFTMRILLEAGITKGMRVLDLGCGAGDVALLVAQMVGQDGAVTGVDWAAIAVETARERARESAISNATFLCAPLDMLKFQQP